MFIISLLLATATLSLAFPHHAKPQAPGSQSCHCEGDNTARKFYTIYVGEPYNDAKCDEFRHNMAEAYSPWNLDYFNKDEFPYFCYKDKTDQFELYFEFSHVNATKLNEVLGDSFPSVNGFNCPSY